MFCAPKRRFRRLLVRFSYFALLNSFSVILRVSGLIFLVCALGLVFGGTEGVGSCFLVLCYRTRFRLYRGRQVPFSCFTPSNSFLEVQWASGPVFLFFAPGLILGGTEVAGSSFHVLLSQTRFRRYRGRLVQF
jgi:hypothetical protein